MSTDTHVSTTTPARGFSSASSSRDFVLAALLLAAVFLVYLPAYYGGLIFDDNEQLTKPALRSLTGLWRIWFEPGATQQYFPLVHTAFWFEQQLWGEAVLGYHLINVLLHASTALILVWVVRKLELRGAWLAAFLFALHPVCAESVAWIAEQKNGLSTVFYLAAFGMYLSFDRSRSTRQYALATGLFVLALLSKTSTVVLPLVLAAVVWWRHGQFKSTRDGRPLLPWFVLSIGAGLMTLFVERKLIHGAGLEVGVQGMTKFLLAGRVICFYLGKCFWPADLTLMYPRWTLDPTVAWQYAFPLAVLIMLGLALKLAPKNRAPLATLLVFIFSLAPFLGFFEIEWFVFGFVADHLQYLALLGLIVPTAAFITQVAMSHALLWRRAGWVGGAALMILLGLLSYRQSQLYKNAETRYRATLIYSPGLYVAHNNLATVLLTRPEDLPEAIDHLQIATRLKPDYVEAHNNLGNAYALSGKLVPAIEEYKAALQLDPTLASIHANLGNNLLKIPGRETEGIREYELAVKLQPDFPEAHNALGAATLQDPAQLLNAIHHLRAALKSKPDYLEAHLNLGNALLNTNAFEQEAIAEYQAALTLNPNFAEAHFNLGVALLRLKRKDEAIVQLKLAASLKPHWAPPVQVLQQLGVKDLER